MVVVRRKEALSTPALRSRPQSTRARTGFKIGGRKHRSVRGACVLTATHPSRPVTCWCWSRPAEHSSLATLQHHSAATGAPFRLHLPGQPPLRVNDVRASGSRARTRTRSSRRQKKKHKKAPPVGGGPPPAPTRRLERRVCLSVSARSLAIAAPLPWCRPCLARIHAAPDHAP